MHETREPQEHYEVDIIFLGNGSIHRRYLVGAENRVQAEGSALRRYRRGSGAMRLDCYANVVRRVPTGELADERYH